MIQSYDTLLTKTRQQFIVDDTKIGGIFESSTFIK